MNSKKKLLLHICCPSCAVFVFRKLRDNYNVTGFFYNPNIHPKKEYEIRKKELIRISNILNFPVIYGEYNFRDWFKEVKGLESEPEKGKRCSVCFNMRLRETFRCAQKSNQQIIASTLSISPYKVTEQINHEGEKLAEIYGIEFLPENFKKRGGYNIGKKMAQELGIIHQNFCGCVYSKVERILRIRRQISK